MHGGKPAGSDPPAFRGSAPKSKSLRITVERIIKFKETPGCRACAGHSRAHSVECRKRFSELVSSHRAEAEKALQKLSPRSISKVDTDGDEELARAIHTSELDKDVAREFDAAEAGEPAPSRPGAPYFDAAPASTAGLAK